MWKCVCVCVCEQKWLYVIFPPLTDDEWWWEWHPRTFQPEHLLLSSTLRCLLADNVTDVTFIFQSHTENCMLHSAGPIDCEKSCQRHWLSLFMGYYSFGAHHSHWAKWSEKVKCVCYVAEASENTGKKNSNIFPHEKISLIDIFQLFSQSAMKWLIAFHKYRCIRGRETTGNVIDIELIKLKTDCRAVNKTSTWEWLPAQSVHAALIWNH